MGGTTGTAETKEHVDLVNEDDRTSLTLLNLLQDALQALLKLSLVLGTGNQLAEVQGNHSLVADALGNLVVDDARGQSLALEHSGKDTSVYLNDGRLAHTCLANEHRIVLLSPRQTKLITCLDEDITTYI